MSWLERFNIRRALRRHAVPPPLWRGTLARVRLLAALSAAERARLRELATLFLARKTFIGANGFIPTDEIRVIIAALACLPILRLGMDRYAGWVELVIYPGAFRVEREETDPGSGIVAQRRDVLDGESWQRGPVVLAWEQIEQDLEHPFAGRNLIIHELAHKLDMLNGRANGMPPLPADMPTEPWTRALSDGYERLHRQVDRQIPAAIDAYAATDPAEFFAVVSEYFFSAPDILVAHFPEIYAQLSAYYRQDPQQRGH